MPTGHYIRTEYHNAISRKNGFQKGNKVNLGRKMKPSQGFQKGHPSYLTEESKKKLAISSSKFWKGRKRPNISREKGYQWKGDDVGYHALHAWVEKELGKPDTCEHCGKTRLTSRQIHWANKSGKYLRELSDWIRLCAKCHKKYDKENNIPMLAKYK